MTRKRFCKLVMSRGYDRDYADLMTRTFLLMRPIGTLSADQFDEMELDKGVILGNAYEDLWTFFNAAEYQGYDPETALLSSAEEVYEIVARYTYDLVDQTMGNVAERLGETAGLFLEIARSFGQWVQTITDYMAAEKGGETT